MDILQAAKQLTGVNWNLRGDALEQAIDGTPRVAAPSAADIQALMDADAYKDQRKQQYPPLADFADAFVHLQNGDPQAMTDYVAKCNAVKAQFPKPQ